MGLSFFQNFLERRQESQDLDLQRMAQLEDLPDEMFEKVFSYLKIGDLLHWGKVSKRFRQIWKIESLWQSVDLDLNNGRGSTVQTDFIIFLLEKGCKYLNLLNVELTGSLKLDKPSKLKGLNLQNCVAKREVLEEILHSCEGHLQQLSIYNIIPQPVFDYHYVRRVILRNSKTLLKINLGQFQWLKETSHLNFFSHCQKLTEIAITEDLFVIRNDQLNLMIDYFPPSLLKVDLSLCNNLTDFHIENLTQKCNKITEISLWGTKVTNQSLISIVKYLKNSLELLDLTACNNINLESIFEAVRSLPKLKYLHYRMHTRGESPYNCFSLTAGWSSSSLNKLCQSCERLKKERPGLFIIGDPYSDIATVGNFNYN